MINRLKEYIFTHKLEVLFLGLVYAFGLYLRLAPRLQIDPHLLTLNADIWERISIAQYFKDHGYLPKFCLRYIAYGQVPLWYPPISAFLFAFFSWLFNLDIATVSSRIVPFIEALTPLSIFFLGKVLFNKRIGYLATMFLSLTPSFNYWSGISDPQSLTLFLLPIYIISLVWRAKIGNDLEDKKRWLWVLCLSFLLAINFLTHLSYFLAVIILLLVSLALIIEFGLRRDFLVDVLVAIIFSQILTIWWWAPKNLYWWWVKSLVTSSGLYTTAQHLKEYGLVIGVIELYSAICLLVFFTFSPSKIRPFIWLIFLWALIPFLETQNEAILRLIKRGDLAWSTIFKPLEGFRFYCFLAQPLAIISAILIDEIFIFFKIWIKRIEYFVVIGLAIILIVDIHKSFGWYVRIKNPGITVDEYNAAVWFRNNSNETDRIVADYYRVQMFAGVCGGKSLLGGLFPLRNVDFPYIKSPGAVVQDDIYNMYKTQSPKEAYNLLKKYKATHIFFSQNLINYGALGSQFKDGFGIDIDKEKFKDKRFFEEVYNHNNDYIIVKVK
ncbi:MAG: glycosyltransferase family 39 protein [Candidatus Omnitrophota bacterium]